MSDWEKVAATDALKPGEIMQVQVNDEPVALAKTHQGDFLACHDVCTHEYVELHDGFIEDDEIECPEHGSRFNMRTGEVRNLPAVVPIATYEVKIEVDNVYLKPKEAT